MARLYQTRPSSLLALEDPYAAWCLDEALADYALRLARGQRLRPKKTTDNAELIAKMLSVKQ